MSGNCRYRSPARATGACGRQVRACPIAVVDVVSGSAVRRPALGPYTQSLAAALMAPSSAVAFPCSPRRPAFTPVRPTSISRISMQPAAIILVGSLGHVLTAARRRHLLGELYTAVESGTAERLHLSFGYGTGLLCRKQHRGKRCDPSFCLRSPDLRLRSKLLFVSFGARSTDFTAHRAVSSRSARQDSRS